MLAWLRAHYPEHQHKEEEEEERREEKKRRSRKDERREPHTPITPPLFCPNTKTPPLFHKDTTLNQQRYDSKHAEGRGNTRGKAGQHKVPDPIRTQGITLTPHPAIQHGHHANRRETPTHRQGTPTHRQEDQQHYPPFHYYATHHHHTTRPSTMAPPTTTTRGEHTEDTPPHKDLGEIVTRTAPHTRQATVHDMTALLSQYALGVDGIGSHARG